MSRPIQLDGATVLLTGAARGIGRAAAAAFVERGARVVLGDIDEPAAVAAASSLGEGAHGLHLDVASRRSFAAFLAAAEELAGPPDVLVNNAGLMPLGAFVEESPTTSRRTLDVNLWGVLLGMRLALPRMVARGRGHVVNVASMMGKVPVPGAAVYAASKFAVVGLSHSIRDELGSSGVTITVVLPSAVRTELLAGVPLGRGLPVIDPGDVAEAIVRCCHTRPPEVFVPAWMGLYEPAVALAPRPLVSAIRRVMSHDRVLTKLDAEARASYERRLRPP